MGPLPVTRGRREACGVWLRCLWAAAGPGWASRSITPSEARVWRSRGRAAAHRHNRPDQVGRPRAARKCGGEDVARERGGEGAERSSWRGLRAGGPPPTGATGRIKWAGLAPPGSVVAKMSRGSEVAKVPSEARGADCERAGRRPQAQPAGSSGQASRRPEVRWRRCRAGAR